MLPLLLDFIEGLPTRIADIKGAAETTDSPKVAALAHKLKGSAGMYGFPELSVLAGKLEALAKEDSNAEFLKYIGQIETILGRIQAAAPGRETSAHQ
jgi:HPt (histidine-containing phosphotransfer) domain-containing protein